MNTMTTLIPLKRNSDLRFGGIWSDLTTSFTEDEKFMKNLYPSYTYLSEPQEGYPL